MNYDSIEKQTRHVTDVQRIQAHLETLTEPEIDKLVSERQQYASVRWEQCRRSFRMLFMALNRGNRFPADKFDIKLKQTTAGKETIDTFVRIWRDRKDDSFNVKPFTRNGRIESHEFSSEKFSGTYPYRYGTHHSKGAVLSVNDDYPDPLIELRSVEGRTVYDWNARTKAIFLAAIEGAVDPSIEETEATLFMVCSAALDPSLNPEHAEKFKIDH